MKNRVLATEKGNFQWNIQRVSKTLPDGKTIHPTRTRGIFVVHGIGQQEVTDTASQLRSGFEDSFGKIKKWQEKKEIKKKNELGELPPPFIYDGHWADYADIALTFPGDWSKFEDREKLFFLNLQGNRVNSISRTIRWFLKQQVRLLHPKVLWEVGPFNWFLYWPLQIVSLITLVIGSFKYKDTIVGFFNDVRLYVDPKGVMERAIVQRIDQRIGEEFLRMIGLDWEFMPLAEDNLIRAGGEKMKFDRVTWVAHSLGSVISYNVLSALFYKATELEVSGTDEQKEGVQKFRNSVQRFITLGSPLDKIAFLFNKKALRPWPNLGNRRQLVHEGETLSDEDSPATEWWINFYHVLDPISGALGNKIFCGKYAPMNFHIHSGFLPGLAHNAYWTDPRTLRFILGRTYGKRYLWDKEYRAWPNWLLKIVAILGYIVWVILLFGVFAAIYYLGPSMLQNISASFVSWISG